MSFKIRDINIFVSEYFLLFVTALLLFDSSGIVVFALAACLLHELGHVLALFLLGLHSYSLEFRMFGIKIIKKETDGNYKEELFFSAMGPCFNMLIAAVWLIINKTPDYFFYMNIAVMIFNILPIYPLDGYRIILNSTAIIFKKNIVSIICNSFTVISIILLFFLSVYILLSYKNPTLLITTIYLMFAFSRKR